MNDPVGGLRSTVGRASGDDASASTHRPAVSVTSVTTRGTRLECTLDYHPRLRPFFDERTLFVEYDTDVSGVPEGIAVIPLLAQVCPVAWAVGADVRAPVVDSRYLDSLETVGGVLAEMYPFVDGGKVIVEEAATDAAGDLDASAGLGADDGEAGMLFTGGVDSLATYVRHRGEDPTLINVRGWMVGADDDRWAHIEPRIEAYGDRFDADVEFVRSNMLDVLGTTMLAAHFSDRHDGGWYSAVGGGLGMLGLCAPLAAATGMDRLYIAASHWAGFPVPDSLAHWDGPAMPWGSHPDIDGNVAWSGTDVVHDGFELTRQERVEVIADYVAESHPDLPVRACESSPTGDNCNDCEKCFRTALGLAFAGLDPTDHGFALDANDFARARRHLATGAWLPGVEESVYWEEFGRLAAERDSLPIEDDAATLRWLRDTDFGGVAGKPVSDRIVRTVARTLPYPVYSRLYPVYNAVIQAVGR